MERTKLSQLVYSDLSIRIEQVLTTGALESWTVISCLVEATTSVTLTVKGPEETVTAAGCNCWNEGNSATTVYWPGARPLRTSVPSAAETADFSWPSLRRALTRAVGTGAPDWSEMVPRMRPEANWGNAGMEAAKRQSTEARVYRSNFYDNGSSLVDSPHVRFRGPLMPINAYPAKPSAMAVTSQTSLSNRSGPPENW